MSATDVENWMHASDEERTQTQTSWDIKNGDGKEIIDAVAALFKDECVYNVMEVAVDNSDTEWLIKCYVDEGDYETLKDRKNVQFLGFRIVFRNVNESPTA